MIQLCKKYGLEEPEFKLESGSFILVLCRKVETEDITPEVILINTIVGEMTRQELQDALNLKDSEHIEESYLQNNTCG